MDQFNLYPKRGPGLIGNSVAPEAAEALVRANVGVFEAEEVAA